MNRMRVLVAVEEARDLPGEAEHHTPLMVAKPLNIDPQVRRRLGVPG
jgi:hypothetical protein